MSLVGNVGLFKPVPITLYGDSYFQEFSDNGDSPPHASRGIGALLAEKFGAIAPVNRSYGGSRMSEAAWAEIGNNFAGVDHSYPAGRKGIVVLNVGINDIAVNADAANGAYQSGFGHALSFFAAACSAASRVEDATFIVNGFQSLSVPQGSAGILRLATTAGSKKSLSATVPTSISIDFLLVVTGSASNPSGDLSATLDGRSAVTFTETGK